MRGRIQTLNCRVMKLLSEFIGFKENILKEVEECCMFTANYPLLLKHGVFGALIVEEASNNTRGKKKR